ncbi:TPA: hypothetical protein ACTPQ1_004490 [Salmonella enterica]
MGLYTEPSMELLCRQVVRDNPELAGRVTPDSVGVRGVPVAKNINGRNTQITLVGKPGKGFAGEATVYYDRLNLTNIFKSSVTLYVPKDKTKVADLLPLLREFYGIQLDISEISVPSQDIKPLATLMPLVITAADSPCYTGTLTVSYAAQPYGYYPDSGPGSKQLLAGDELYGYFGMVSQDIMLNAVDLWTGAFPGISLSSNQMTGFTWLKFFMDGKVVYLPSKGVGPTSYSSLYAAGAVYGTGDYGTPPSGVSDPTVVQQLYLSKTENGKTYYFSLRIPVDGNQSVAPLSILRRLGDGVTAGEWGNETSVDWNGQILFSYSSGSKNIIGNLKGSGGSWIDIWVGAQWWPIVELLDKSQAVLPLADIEGVLEWACVALPPTSTSGGDNIKPISVELGTTPLPRPLPGDSEMGEITIKPIGLEAPAVVMPRPLAGDSLNLGFVIPIGLDSPHVEMPRPLAPGKAPEPEKIKLASANGELDGFL